MGLGPHSSGREEVKETGRLSVGRPTACGSRDGASPSEKTGPEVGHSNQSRGGAHPEIAAKFISSRFSVRVRVTGQDSVPSGLSEPPGLLPEDP